MKRGQETFRVILDTLLVSPRFSTAARAASISESTLFSWLAASQRGEKDFIVENFFGESGVQLVDACKQCRRMAALKITQALESRALCGDWLESRYRGQRVFELDPRFLDWSDQDFRDLGIDVGLRYKRDDRGLPINVLTWSPPPEKLALAVASAHWPRLYGAKSEVSLSVRGSLGVHTVPAKALPQVTVVAAAAIAPPPIDQGDDDLSDLLDGAPENDIEDGDFVEVEPLAAPMASEPAPAPPSYGPLQIDLLNKLRKGMKTV
jgi:hypothetical protein